MNPKAGRCTLRVCIVSPYSRRSDYRFSSTLIPEYHAGENDDNDGGDDLFCLYDNNSANKLRLTGRNQLEMANNSNGIWGFKSPHLVPSTARIGKPARMTALEDPASLLNQPDLDLFPGMPFPASKVLHWADQLRTGMVQGS